MTLYIDNTLVEGNLRHTSYSPVRTVTTTTLNGTLILDNTSSKMQNLVGTAVGYSIRLPDATTLTTGWEFIISNISALPITIRYSTGTQLIQVTADAKATVSLHDNNTVEGEWIVTATDLTNIDMNNPNFLGAKDGFEDFMFDAYAGNGGNDNQYAFTAVPSTGSSNIDGTTEVVGTDYEGIHILSSLTSATAAPLVHAFNGVNRIKFGTHLESYELRVRIETLATVTEKFVCKYGLMDGVLAGVPANGVIFHYDPVYPVTPVKQIVTATPNSLTQAPDQHFIQTVNGVNYDYNYKVYQTVTATPNSLPNATYQQISVTWTRANNTLYTVTINGTACSYTSDASATDVEIALGLGNAINAAVGAAVTATTTGKPITVTSDVLGQAFTYSTNANCTATLVTANVVKAVYTETIAGVPYQYTSDGTPTAAEVVSDLIALVNADSGCPATASGTTVLTLTSKVLGGAWTYSGTANLTQADTTTAPTATGVCNALRSLMAADSAVSVSGTVTLIMTAKVAGIAFTYSGSANLTEVLTTANVPEVLYSGNWIATVVKASTATSYDTGVPVVAGQWYRLKAIINATGTQAAFYVDNLFIDELITPCPVVGLRYVFKLEKTLGTTARTTSIDYISWRRTRG